MSFQATGGRYRSRPDWSSATDSPDPPSRYHLLRCSVAASLRRTPKCASFGWLGRALQLAPIRWPGKSVITGSKLCPASSMVDYGQRTRLCPFVVPASPGVRIPNSGFASVARAQTDSVSLPTSRTHRHPGPHPLADGQLTPKQCALGVLQHDFVRALLRDGGSEASPPRASESRKSGIPTTCQGASEVLVGQGECGGRPGDSPNGPRPVSRRIGERIRSLRGQMGRPAIWRVRSLGPG
jgi:hypothetical protein